MSSALRPILDAQQDSYSFSLTSSIEEINSEQNNPQELKRCKRESISSIESYKEYPDSDNEEFENHYDLLKIITEKGMGKGVKTTTTLKKNTLLGEYTGRHLTYAKAYEKMKLRSVHFIVRTDLRTRYIDGEGKEGCILKYINHKCIDSNCELIKLTRGRVGIITKRDILEDEVLNYDYRLAYFKDVPKKGVRCVCCDDCQNYL
jgi:hypothetical protein